MTGNVVETEITNMAYAFNRALGDGCLSESDLEDIKRGIRAAFAEHLAATRIADEKLQSILRNSSEWAYVPRVATPMMVYSGAEALGDLSSDPQVVQRVFQQMISMY